MNRHDIAQQTLVETGMLNHLMEALRTTLAWQVHGEDFSRKLTTLRFIAQSFQRHLEHLFTLEEFDGYMDLVMQTSPRLSKQVDALKTEHQKFRQEARRIVHSLERVSAADALRFAKVCDDLLFHLQKLEEHSQREIQLLQESLGREGGGEG